MAGRRDSCRCWCCCGGGDVMVARRYGTGAAFILGSFAQSPGFAQAAVSCSACLQHRSRLLAVVDRPPRAGVLNTGCSQARSLVYQVLRCQGDVYHCTSYLGADYIFGHCPCAVLSLPAEKHTSILASLSSLRLWRSRALRSFILSGVWSCFHVLALRACR